MGTDFAKKIAAGAVWLLIWLLCWLTVGKDVLIPSPAAVLLRLGQLICTLPFWQQVGLSLLRILTGFALALVLGAVFGALTARSALADTLLSPALRTVRAIPVASFIILLFVLMSKEYIPTVTSFLMVLPVVWSNVDQGVRSTDIQLLEMAQVPPEGAQAHLAAPGGPFLPGRRPDGHGSGLEGGGRRRGAGRPPAGHRPRSV